MTHRTALLSLILSCACSSGARFHAEARAGVGPGASCRAAVSSTGPAEAQLQRASQQLAAAENEAGAWVDVGSAWVRMARVHSRPEYWRQVEDCATQALARGPKDVRALRLQGLVFMNAHRFAEARALAQDMLARDADDPLSWGTLSDAELELGHLDEAIAAAQHMVDRKPNLLSYGRAAHLRWLTGDRSGAKRLYQTAIAAGQQQADPEPRTWLTVQAAWVFWHEGDYHGAATGFGLALSQLPDYVPALEGLGRTALSQGDHAAAIRWLSRAQQLHPLAETAWWLGDAYALAGEPARADEAYRDVVRLAERGDPRTLALFLATHGREAREAVRLARLALRERQDCYTQDVLAFALFRAGELAEAKQLMQRVLAVGVPDARLLYHAGLIYRAAGDAAPGGELITRALALNPGFDPQLLQTGGADALQTARL